MCYRSLYRLSLRLKGWGVGLLLVRNDILGNELSENRKRGTMQIVKNSQRSWKHEILRILVDGKVLNEVIIPLMNVSRRAACGMADPNDITNKSQIYVNFSVAT